MISGSIALALLFFAELGLRILYPEKVLDIAEQRRHIHDRGPIAYEVHPEYLVALKPNVSKTFVRSRENGGDVVRWTTNTASFRGPELRLEPELRVMVYGDSNIQARFSHLEKSFPYKLQEYLTSLSARDVEVINAGVIGFGPDQVLIKFSQEVDIYKPDIVVFHIFADNDFGDIVRNNLFELDAEGDLVRTNLKPAVDLEFTQPRLLITKAALSLLKPVGVKNVPPELLSIEESVGTSMALTDMEYAAYNNGSRSLALSGDRYDLDIALDSKSDAAKTKVSLLDRILREAKAIADEKGVGLVVLIQPSSRDLTQNLPSMNYGDLQKHPDYRKDRLTSIVDAICSRYQVQRVNLYPVFLNNTPQSLFFKVDDNHWNDAGQDLAARETADYIHEHFWINHPAD